MEKLTNKEKLEKLKEVKTKLIARRDFIRNKWYFWKEEEILNGKWECNTKNIDMISDARNRLESIKITIYIVETSILKIESKIKNYGTSKFEHKKDGIMSRHNFIKKQFKENGGG